MTTDNQQKKIDLDFSRTLDIGPDEFKAARHALKLTTEELAVLLDTDKRSIRCIEADPRSSQFRKPAPRMVRLLEAYLSGYRPPDWPSKA